MNHNLNLIVGIYVLFTLNYIDSLNYVIRIQYNTIVNLKLNTIAMTSNDPLKDYNILMFNTFIHHWAILAL